MSSAWVARLVYYRRASWLDNYVHGHRRIVVATRLPGHDGPQTQPDIVGSDGQLTRQMRIERSYSANGAFINRSTVEIGL